MLISIVASAQKNNVWRGGASDHETDWSCFKNWSNGRTPNEFDHVVIPDVSTSTNNYPIIHSGEIEVWSLEVQTGAILTLMPKARLLTGEVQVSGTCKGYGRRLLPEGTAEVTAFNPEK